MPKYKNPNRRLSEIYEFICQHPESGKKRISKFLIQNGINVSDKTINNDLAELVTQGLILSSGKGRSVEYVPVDKLRYLIVTKDILDHDDLFSLEMALLSLNQLKFFSLSQDLKNVMSKIERVIKREYKHAGEIVSFQNSFLQLNPEIFQRVFEGTSFRKVLDISYKSFSAANPSAFMFHPYFLKQYNNRWFVIGYREDLKKVDNIGIERIQLVSMDRKTEFRLEDYISPTAYSNHLFGVTRPCQKPVKIELTFSKERAPYFISKPIMDSITVKSLKDGRQKISFLCIVNKELISELLSYGCDVEIVKPSSLRKEIKDILKKAFESYL
jgi:predicted DNA-binding transcriptional regulator YafY